MGGARGRGVMNEKRDGALIDVMKRGAKFEMKIERENMKKQRTTCDMGTAKKKEVVAKWLRVFCEVQEKVCDIFWGERGV